MVKENKWIAWIAVIALVLAVVALVFIIKGSMTGNAIFSNSGSSVISKTTLSKFGFERAQLFEGEYKSFFFGGQNYPVSIDFISTSKVKFNIGGVLTQTLTPGQSQVSSCWSIYSGDHVSRVGDNSNGVDMIFHSWC